MIPFFIFKDSWTWIHPKYEYALKFNSVTLATPQMVDLWRALNIETTILWRFSQKIRWETNIASDQFQGEFLDQTHQNQKTQLLNPILPGLPAVSVQWGPWAEVGMAARAGTTESGGYLRLDPTASLQARVSFG